MTWLALAALAATHLTDQAARVVQVPYRRTTTGEDDHAA